MLCKVQGPGLGSSDPSFWNFPIFTNKGFFPGIGQLCRFLTGLTASIPSVRFAPSHSKATQDMCGLYSIRLNYWNCGCFVTFEHFVYLSTVSSDFVQISLFHFTRKVDIQHSSTVLKYLGRIIERILSVSGRKRAVLKMPFESAGQFVIFVAGDMENNCFVPLQIKELYRIISLLVSKRRKCKIVTFIKKYGSTNKFKIIYSYFKII